MKGSLTAEVTLYADGDLFEQIQALQDELRFVLITSYATVKPVSEKTDTAVTTDVDGCGWMSERWINRNAVAAGIIEKMSGRTVKTRICVNVVSIMSMAKESNVSLLKIGQAWSVSPFDVSL